MLDVKVDRRKRASRPEWLLCKPAGESLIAMCSRTLGHIYNDDPSDDFPNRRHKESRL